MAATKALHKLVNIEPSTVVNLEIYDNYPNKIDHVPFGKICGYRLPDVDWGGLIHYHHEERFDDPEFGKGFFMDIASTSLERLSIFVLELSILCSATHMLGGIKIYDYEGSLSDLEGIDINELYSLKTRELLDFESAAQEFVQNLPLKLRLDLPPSSKP
ncbi:hypothetical protein GVN21_13490 [Caulobacter sp. SLTY]|uniref:hypothetical protein n=1 Tax=Caulobacter sp. SLTY TaxID=2683262 RepID=UPI001411B839|nr:hypothetical protein [Caulobacter sp. SLTY]NBB16373.1 hypothetical protein [Caulobacter sp. SLTY]